MQLVVNIIQHPSKHGFNAIHQCGDIPLWTILGPDLLLKTSYWGWVFNLRHSEWSSADIRHMPRATWSMKQSKTLCWLTQGSCSAFKLASGTDSQSLLSRGHRFWHRQTKSTPEECDLEPTVDEKVKAKSGVSAFHRISWAWGICSTIRPMPIRPVPTPTLSQAPTSPMFGSEMLRVPKPTQKVQWYSLLFRRWKQRTRLRKDIKGMLGMQHQFLSRALWFTQVVFHQVSSLHGWSEEWRPQDHSRFSQY